MPRFSAVGKAIFYPIKPNGKQGKGQLMKEVIMYCDHDGQSKNLDEEFAKIGCVHLFVKSGKKEYKLYFPLDMDDSLIGVECKKLAHISLCAPHLYTALENDIKTEK